MKNGKEFAELTASSSKRNGLAGALLRNDMVFGFLDHAPEFGGEFGMTFPGFTSGYLHGDRQETTLVTFAVTLNESADLFG